MLSTVIFTDGAQKNVEPSNGTDFSLEELRGICRWPHRVGPTQQVAGNGS